MNYYDCEINEVLDYLNSSRTGLSSEEAEDRLKKYGKNLILGKKKRSKIVMFFAEFNDLMIIILILSAIISFFLSLINHESFTDSIIILGIVLLNAILSFLQEIKADNAIEALKKMNVSSVKVKRDNKFLIVNSEDIVVGDILILEAGDSVPVDARIIWDVALKVDESALTGESVAVIKNCNVLNSNVVLSDRKNMLYAGTNIVYGKCQAVVVKTGVETEFGKIAMCLNEDEKEVTQLQHKINEISKFLSFIILAIILIMFVIGLIKGMEIKEVVMLAISLAVAAIPEGLPAVITIILSLGMNVMAKKNAIVRKMTSVETLGSTEVICSDKTGTITENKMKVREVYFNNKIYLSDEVKNCDILLHGMVLNNDVEVNSGSYIGDPTEIALYDLGKKYLDIESFKNNNCRLDELPFDSERKMMSVIVKNVDKFVLYTKGSFDSIIKCCSYVYEDNKVIKLTAKIIDRLKQVEKAEADKAYRVLAFAYKEIEENYILNNRLESNLIFVGLVALMDSPRCDVRNSIEECRKAGIKPVMITGDSLDTAIAVGKEVGILKNEAEAITGEILDSMDEDVLVKEVENYSVYARVSPMNKLAIVNAWKSNGKIVAMTGDGVNDAPALKSADIGIGMGITGTDVSKNVSDIILADDSFSTIVTAIKEGRKIYDNIRNVLVYLLTGNIAEIAIVFAGMIFGIEIFLPIQLLYINLITDSIPAIALAFEDCDRNILYRKTHNKDKSFFSPFLIAKIGLSSMLKSFLVLLMYFINLKIYGVNMATSMAFLSLIMMEMFFAFSCRNLKESVVNKNMFKNKVLNKSMFILGILQIVIFVTPVRNIFSICSLSLIQWFYCFVVVLIVFLIDEETKKLIDILFKD